MILKDYPRLERSQRQSQRGASRCLALGFAQTRESGAHRVGRRAHQGHDEIERWLRQAHADDWVIITSAAAGDLLVAEWRRGDQEGVTVARPSEGRIHYLREYVTT